MTFAEIVPLIRLPRTTNTFTYQIPSELEGLVSIGQFVEIPWRRQQLVAGVIASLHQKPPKGFKISQIKKVLEDSPSWSKQHITALITCAQYYYSSPATLALGFTPDIPKKLHEKKTQQAPVRLLPIMKVQKKSADDIPSFIKDNSEIKTIKYQQQAERLLFYRQLCAANNGQVLIITPQYIEAEEIYYFLNKYFSEEVFLWNNQLSKNQQWHDWQAIRDNKKRIIISTRSGTFLPCQNLCCILIDQEERSDFKSWDSSPHYDARECAKVLAKNFAIPLYQLSLHPTIDNSPSQKLFKFPSQMAAIYSVYHQQSRPLIHKSIHDQIVGALEKKSSPVIIMTQKAKAKTLRCLDCHHQWLCAKCNYNLSIKGSSLICSSCNSTSSIPSACPECKGQRIKSYGLGVEGMINELHQQFPQANLVSFTSETTEELDQIISPSIIVSTGFMLKRLLTKEKQKWGPIILFKPEELLYIPDYRANKKLYDFVNWHRSIAADYFESNLTIQTCLNEEDPLYQIIIKDDYQTFRSNEIVSRQKYLYPPYSTIYKITCKNEGEDFNENINKLDKMLRAIESAQIIGPIDEYRNDQRQAVNWQVKTTELLDNKLDKTLDFLYSKVVIDINPL